jgi:hypothetical protein
MFPHGWPGIGLAMLRISVAVPILLSAYDTREELPQWALIAHVLVSASLSAGFLTPIVAVLAPLVQLVGPTSAAMGSQGIICTTILNALALTVLGPGAYSIDACRFGRRTIELPVHNPSHPLSRCLGSRDR